MRAPVEITKESAVYIAKYFVGEQAKKETNFIRKFALNSSLEPGGGIDQIADMLYGLGIKLSIDKSNTDHVEWLRSGAAVEDKKE